MGLFDKIKSTVKNISTEKPKDTDTEEKTENNIPSKKKKEKGKEKEKPEGVPVEAIWNKKNKEWELGEKNAEGFKIGTWKYWLKKGHLVCQTIHEGEKGEDFTFTRFHNDGTYSQKGAYKNNLNHGTTYYQKSVNKTKEKPIPESAPDNIFSMTYEWELGELISSQFFDKDGDELDQRGTIINPIKRGDIPEDALWNIEVQEWEKGETTNGILTRWDVMGSKSTEQVYDEGIIINEKQFHPDGTVFYEEQYEKGNPYMKYRMYSKSVNETYKEFPQGGVTANAFKLEYFHNEHGFLTLWKTSDVNGNTIEENPIYSNLENRTPNTKFKTIEEASKIWNEKGDKYYNNINWWLSQYYSKNHDVPEGTPEPIDNRFDMERVILEALETLNKDGQPQKVRELFTPSYEPISKFTWRNLGKNVTKVISLNEQKSIALIDGICYVLDGTTISKLQDVIAVGSSKDKNFVAKAYTDRIEVTKGLDGGIINIFKYPKQFLPAVYEHFPNINTNVFNTPSNLDIIDIKISSDGEKGLLITKEGIYLLDQHDAKQIYPHSEKMKELLEHFSQCISGNIEDYNFNIGIEYPNADFSADDKYIVAGGKLPSPILAGTSIYAIEGKTIILKKYTEQKSLFGIVNEFHPNGKDMLHGTCLYATINSNWSNSMDNTTFRLGVEQIEDGELELDNFAGAYAQMVGMVHSVCPLEDGFAIGNNKGYIWHYNGDSQLMGHTHIGGTIKSMDISPDKKYIVIGTNEGQVIRLKCITERGKGMITDMNVEDIQRYIFFRSYEPMVW